MKSLGVKKIKEITAKILLDARKICDKTLENC
jgi:hypothetical protein